MYRQVDGVAMGSSLGPSFANIFMAYLEYKAIPELLNQNIYLQYMDECLVISKRRDDTDALFDKLNGLYEAICFTKEVKSNNTLPFLDILILLENDRFLMMVYRKASLYIL